MKDMYNIPVSVTPDQSIGASSDFGNVSQEMPGCHPMFNIKSKGSNHTEGFTVASKSEQAHGEAMKHTAGIACVGIKFLTDADFAKSVRESWQKDMDKVKKEQESVLSN